MPQYFGLQVFDPTIRINQVAVRVLCDGINRQIAACQVLLKGNGRIRVANESAMALARVALRAVASGSPGTSSSAFSTLSSAVA